VPAIRGDGHKSVELIEQVNLYGDSRMSTPLPPQERIKNSFLRSEYERSGVPVYEVSYREWKKRFYALTNEDYDYAEEFMGVYYSGPFDLKTEDLPRRFIVINRNLSNSWKLAVFYHELGHHACAIGKCTCAKDGFDFRSTELHAELAGIYIAHARQFKKITFNMLIDAVLDLDNERFNRIYNATRIVKHPVFIRAKNDLNGIFKEWLKKHSRLREKYLNAIVDDDTRTCRWSPSTFLQKFIEGNVRS
jgi:hypothetical protein